MSRLQLPRLAVLLCALLYCSTSFAQIDLELSILTDNPDIEQWERGKFTLLLENKGSEDATGVSVTMPLNRAEVVLVGSVRPTASSGSYRQAIWNNINIPANGSATLELELYNKVKDLKLFAEVVAADQDDIDSTPNNGLTNEDDEAYFPIDDSGNMPAELVILAVNCPREYPTASGRLSMNVTIRNTGNLPSEGRVLGLYRTLNGEDGIKTGEKYSDAAIPTILGFETTTLSLNYGIPFEQYWTPGTTIAEGLTVVGDALSFDGGETLDFELDLYCQKDESDISINILSEETNYGEDGLIHYKVEVSNTGNKDVHNLRVTYGINDLAEYGQVLEAMSLYANSYTQDPSYGREQYWLIENLAAAETAVLEVTYQVNTAILDEIFIESKVESPHLIDTNPDNNATGLVFLNQITTEEAVDLELSMITDTPDLAQWSSGKFTLLLENKGESDATGVAVRFALPSNEVTLVGSTAPRVSSGTFKNGLWEEIYVPAGEQATLQIELYNKSPELELFAQVIASDQPDIDSAPDNGTCCLLEEDDEATLLSDLTLSNVGFPSIIERGEDFRFTIDVDNIGYATAKGDFILGFYLSKDEVLEEGDRFIGIVRTADLTVDKHQANALINVAPDVLPGEYYLLAVVDVDGTVQEIDESNNVHSSPVIVGRGGAADLQLRFSSPSPEVNTFVALPMTLTISNTGDGDATGVIVYFPLETGKVVLAGGAAPSFSRGNYNYFNGMWYVNDLPAGESATVSIDLFPIADDYVPFAEVIALDQEDIDSAPDNGVCCSPNEDDEAAFPEGAVIGDKIDMELSFSTPNTEIGKFETLPVKLHVRNTGTVTTTDVIVSLEACAATNTRLFANQTGLVYSNRPSEASLGNYNKIQQLWRIPSLDAGQSAVLDLQLYSITEEPVRIRAIAIRYMGDDVDSSPEQFDFEACNASEDDEAVLDINMNNGFANDQEWQVEQPTSVTKAFAYPNPVNDILHIQLPDSVEDELGYSLYDMQGKKRLMGTWQAAGQEQELNLQGIQAGLYILRLEHAGTQELIRVAKL